MYICVYIYIYIYIYIPISNMDKELYYIRQISHRVNDHPS